MTWDTVRLGDLYQRRRTTTPAAGTKYTLYSVPAYETGRPQRVDGAEIQSGKQYLEAGDVLLCRIVPHIRRAWVVSPHRTATIGSTEWIVLRHPRFDQAFLRQYLLCDEFHTKFMSTLAGVGGSLSRARPAAAARIEIPAPPLPEQRRIAAILDEAGTLRARAVSQLTRLDEVEDRAFHSLLGGSVGASVTLGDVAEELRYGTSVKSGPTGLPVLRIPNITGRSVDASDLKTVELSSAETDRLRLTDRDVLFVRSNGNPDVVGRCSAFSSLEASVRGSSDWVFASYLIRARLRPGVDPHAIAALARSAVGRRHLRAGAATSAGQYNINTAVLRSLPAFDPTHPAQTTFGSISRNIDAQRVRARHVIDELDSLFASLQHRAFRGEL